MKKLYTYCVKAVITSIFVLPALIAAAVTHTVQVMDFSFTPANVNAQVGDTIRWVHVNGSHTTTSGTIPVGALPWNAPINSTMPTFSYKVTRVGLYNYFCTPHAPNMAGTITVTQGTGISEEPSSVYSWIAYPQPFKNELHISTGNFSGNIQAELYDLTGRLLMSEQKHPSGQRGIRFDTAELKPGVYFCNLFADNKKRTIRVVKE